MKHLFSQRGMKGRRYIKRESQSGWQACNTCRPLECFYFCLAEVVSFLQIDTRDLALTSAISSDSVWRGVGTVYFKEQALVSHGLKNQMQCLI